jgi:hypothetical protein
MTWLRTSDWLSFCGESSTGLLDNRAGFAKALDTESGGIWDGNFMFGRFVFMFAFSFHGHP